MSFNSAKSEINELIFQQTTENNSVCFWFLNLLCRKTESIGYNNVYKGNHDFTSVCTCMHACETAKGNAEM